MRLSLESFSCADFEILSVERGVRDLEGELIWMLSGGKEV